MENEQKSEEQTKKCPKCAEFVQKEAQICKHCGNKFVNKTRKGLGIGCLIFLIMLWILILSIGSSNNDDNVTTGEKSEKQTVGTPDQLIENFILDNKILKRENLKNVTYSDETNTIKIEYNPHSSIGSTSYSIISEASFVRDLYTYLVKIGKEAFNMSDIKIINIVAYIDNIDKYGNKEEIKGAEIIFSKEEFDKFKWDNLKLQNVYNEIKSSSLEHYVDPIIMKGINPEQDLFLAI